jgi:hypothetical protein
VAISRYTDTEFDCIAQGSYSPGCDFRRDTNILPIECGPAGSDGHKTSYSIHRVPHLRHPFDRLEFSQSCLAGIVLAECPINIFNTVYSYGREKGRSSGRSSAGVDDRAFFVLRSNTVSPKQIVVPGRFGYCDNGNLGGDTKMSVTTPISCPRRMCLTGRWPLADGSRSYIISSLASWRMTSVNPALECLDPTKVNLVALQAELPENILELNCLNSVSHWSNVFPRRPNKTEFKPPVLVPHIKSKH